MCSTVADALATAEATVTVLARQPVEGCSDAELLDRSARLVAVRNQLDAALAGTVRRAENQQSAEHDGLKTMTSWLRAHTRLSNPAIGSVVRQGRAMEHLPAVEAAYVAGAITGDSVETIAEIVQPEHLDRAVAQDVDLGEIQTALLDIATTHPHRALQQAVARYLAQLEPDGREPDPTEERALTVAQHPDGSVTLGGSLDQVGGEKVMTALEAYAAAGRTAGDTRTRPQRVADALVQMADVVLAAGLAPVLRSVKPQLIVTIPLADILQPLPGHGTGTTGTGAALSAARARWISCDSGVTRLVMTPDGIPMDQGRTQRLVTPAQRRALDVRDRGCVFAGCSAPTWFCDAHHLLEWVFGGRTDLDNLGLLCERHHTKVHHGYRVQRQPDGRWRTWRPDGTEILLGAYSDVGPRSSAVRTSSGQGVERPSAMAT